MFKDFDFLFTKNVLAVRRDEQFTYPSCGGKFVEKYLILRFSFHADYAFISF
jgi:hypothetical protein